MFSKLARDLGKGETAVILNGLESPGSLVILDDFLARNVARELGLKVSSGGRRRGLIMEQIVIQANTSVGGGGDVLNF